jgi:hypothetical protein
MARRFNLGAVVATTGALALLSRLRIDPRSLLQRHIRGDWGDLDEEDRRLNDEAVGNGSRILSSYRVGSAGETAWVITDAVDDFGIRHVTTVLLPEDY